MPASADVISGETFTHTLTLTNTGTLPACFTLTVFSSLWPAAVPNGEVSVQPGFAISLPVTVRVPLTASIGMTNVTVVDISSIQPPLVRTATLETIVTKEPTSEPGATQPPIYFPWIHNE
jgi:hypothetical protein